MNDVSVRISEICHTRQQKDTFVEKNIPGFDMNKYRIKFECEIQLKSSHDFRVFQISVSVE